MNKNIDENLIKQFKYNKYTNFQDLIKFPDNVNSIAHSLKSRIQILNYGDKSYLAINVSKSPNDAKFSPTFKNYILIDKEGKVEKSSVFPDRLLQYLHDLNLEEANKIFHLKIVGCDLTNIFFGSRTAEIKKTMVGNVYKDFEIICIKNPKANLEETFCARIVIDGNNFTFAMTDIQFILPKNISGINLPKDTTFKVGEIVYYKKDPSNLYKIVRKVYNNKYSKLISKRSLDRKRDVFSCVLIDPATLEVNPSSNLIHMYASDIKRAKL